MNSITKHQLKLFLIFLLSANISLSILFIGNQIIKYQTHQRMIAGAVASSREEDGAENLVILNGDSGTIGESKVYLEYLDRGYIKIKGTNATKQAQWKLLTECQLEKGVYSLVGLPKDNGGFARLRIAKVTGDNVITLAWQENEDTRFSVDETSIVRLHVLVLPGVKVDLIARPAIYREHGDE